MSGAFVKQILKGTIIGVANIIPGVSGGTLAVSMGIYDQIIQAITQFFKQPKKSMRTLLPYGIGAVVGIIGLSFCIEWLFKYYPLETNLFFIGLIIGALPILYKKVKGKPVKGNYILAFLVMFIIVVGMSLMKGKSATQEILTMSIGGGIELFLVGIIAAATMVIPGVSGSMILALMGFYLPIIETINHCIKGLIHLDWVTCIASGMPLVPFGIGVVVGIFLIAKIIEFLLERYETLVYWAIIGLVIGSSIAIWITSGVVVNGIFSWITAALCFVLGSFIAYNLAK
ncbi:DUF368 domain-containing protein [Niameybacter massiliensis]|uniref:DUF368 domain-containing protein n=1 Tax=Holtiella tumoricola TaxID=3018743 RepID=A0AA42DK62_9FIRM|nr:DUF368 domain-containing protein [Holtiella tumoricola]MDA3730345.1 DUF368 domain-containing protein [Holtiella tumoricola]